MSLFSKKTTKKKHEIVLVLDIGSSSVGGALVVLSENEKPHVLYHRRSLIAFQKELAFDRFVTTTLQTLQKVLEDVQRKGITHINELYTRKRKTLQIDRVLVVYSSPWYQSETKTINLRKSEPVTVSEVSLTKLIQEEAKKAMHDTADAKTKNDGDIIEQKIISLTLNGYPVHAIEGKKAKEIQATISMTMLSASVKAAVVERIQSVFHTDDITHHSFALVAMTVIKDLFKNEDTFLSIDVGGEVTDISFVQNGILVETVSFPQGLLTFLRKIQNALGVEFVQAASLLRTYISKVTHGPERADVADVVEHTQEEWLANARSALTNFTQALSLNQPIFFTTDTTFAPFFKEILQTFAHGSVSNTDQRAAVQFLNDAILRKHIVFPGRVIQDSFLAIEGIYFNKLFNL